MVVSLVKHVDFFTYHLRCRKRRPVIRRISLLATKNLEELSGTLLLVSFFMALGFSVYEVGWPFLIYVEALLGFFA